MKTVLLVLITRSWLGCGEPFIEVENVQSLAACKLAGDRSPIGSVYRCIEVASK